MNPTKKERDPSTSTGLGVSIHTTALGERDYLRQYHRASTQVRATIHALHNNHQHLSQHPYALTPPPMLSVRSGTLLDGDDDDDKQAVAATPHNHVRARLHRAQQQYELERKSNLWVKFSPAMQGSAALASIQKQERTREEAERNPQLSRQTRVVKMTVHNLLRLNPDYELLQVLRKQIQTQEDIELRRRPLHDGASRTALDLSSMSLSVTDCNLVCDVLAQCAHVTSLNVSNNDAFANAQPLEGLMSLVTKNDNITSLDATNCRIPPKKLKAIFAVVTANAHKVERRVQHAILVQQHASHSAALMSERAGKFEIVTTEEARRRDIIRLHAEELGRIARAEREGHAAVSRRVLRREVRLQHRNERIDVERREWLRRCQHEAHVLAQLPTLLMAVEAHIRQMWVGLEEHGFAAVEGRWSANWAEAHTRERVRLHRELQQYQKVERDESVARIKIIDDWEAPLLDYGTMEATSRRDTAKREQARLVFSMREGKARRQIDTEADAALRTMEAQRHAVFTEIRHREAQQRACVEGTEDEARLGVEREMRLGRKTLEDMVDTIRLMLAHERVCENVVWLRRELTTHTPNIQLNSAGGAQDSLPVVLLIPDTTGVHPFGSVRLATTIGANWSRDFDRLRTIETDNNKRRLDIVRRQRLFGEADLELHEHPPLMDTQSAKARKEEILDGFFIVACKTFSEPRGEGGRPAMPAGKLYHPELCPGGTDTLVVPFSKSNSAPPALSAITNVLQDVTFALPPEEPYSASLAHFLERFPVARRSSVVSYAELKAKNLARARCGVELGVCVSFSDPLLPEEQRAQRIAEVTKYRCDFESAGRADARAVLTVPSHLSCTAFHFDILLSGAYLQQPSTAITFNHKMGLSGCRLFRGVKTANPSSDSGLRDFHGGKLVIEAVSGLTPFDFIFFADGDPPGMEKKKKLTRMRSRSKSIRARSLVADADSSNKYVTSVRHTTTSGDYFEAKLLPDDSTAELLRTSAVAPDVYESHAETPRFVFKLEGSAAEIGAIRRHLLEKIAFSNISVDPVPGPRRVRLSIFDRLGRGSSVEFDVVVEVKDDPTEVTIPHPVTHYLTPPHQFMVPRFVSEYVDPVAATEIFVFKKVRVMDEDTDHFAGGFMTITIRDGDGGVCEGDELFLSEGAIESIMELQGGILWRGNKISDYRALSPHDLRFDFTRDGEATIRSTQDLLRCVKLRSTSSKIGTDRFVSLHIEFGPSARKRRLDGSMIEVTDEMMRELSDPIEMSVKVEFAACALTCDHEYTMCKYVEGTGFHPLGACDVNPNLTWSAGGSVAVEIIEARDECDFLSIQSSPVYRLAPHELFPNEPQIAFGDDAHVDFDSDEENEDNEEGDEAAEGLDCDDDHMDERSMSPQSSMVGAVTATFSGASDEGEDNNAAQSVQSPNGAITLDVPGCLSTRSSTLVISRRQSKNSRHGSSSSSLVGGQYTFCHENVVQNNTTYLKLTSVSDPDTVLAYVAVTHPARIDVRLVGNCPPHIMRSLLQNVVYANNSANPINLVKLVRMTATPSVNATVSTLFYEARIHPVDNVTQVHLPHTVMTYRPAVDEAVPFMLFPRATGAELTDPDTFFFDGGYMLVEFVSGAQKGDDLYLLSTSQQEDDVENSFSLKKKAVGNRRRSSSLGAAGRRPSITKLGSRRSSITSMTGPRSSLTPRSPASEGLSPKGIISAANTPHALNLNTPTKMFGSEFERSRRSSGGGVGGAMMRAAAYLFTLNDASFIIEDDNIKAIESEGDDDEGDLVVPAGSPRILIPRVESQSVVFHSDGVPIGTLTRPLTHCPSGTKVDVRDLRIDFPAKEHPHIRIGLLTHIMNSIAFTTTATPAPGEPAVPPRAMRITVGDGRNPEDGTRDFTVHVRAPLFWLAQPPRVQLLPNTPPRAVFPSGMMFSFSDSDSLLASSGGARFNIRITDGCDDETDALVFLPKVEGDVRVDSKNNLLTIGGVPFGAWSVPTVMGTATEIDVVVPPPSDADSNNAPAPVPAKVPGLKQLMQFTKAIAIRTTGGGASKRVVLRGSIGANAPARWCEVSIDIKVL
eukprot:PhM_4_TR2649/c0_g1_i1/m.38577